MKGLTAAVMTVFLLAPVYSAAQMRHGMDKHMEGHEGHMGNGMDGSAQNTEDKNAEKNHAAGAWHVKVAEEAGVKVKVTYKNPGKDKGPVFNIVLDTHSVDLDGYKFNDIVFLRDDTGKVYKPVTVSEAGSGHHREATVEFKDASASSSKTLTLVVKDVAGKAERIFEFDAGGKRGK